MKKLKIGIITHNFPLSEKDRQNAGTFVYDFAKALNKKAKVVVFAPGAKDQIKEIGGIKTYFFKFKEKLGDLRIYNPLHLFKLVYFFIKGKKALNRFINENSDIDFILSMWAFPSGFFAYDIFRRKKIPYAIYSLGSDIYVYAKKPILKTLINTYLASAKFRIADSPDLSSEVKKISGKEALFIPSSSDLRQAKSKIKVYSKKTTLTFLGRLEKIKGVDLFVDSLMTLKLDLQANIIGDGALLNWVKQKAAASSNIKVWGNVSNTRKISQILNSSDWLVIPSRSDSIPLVFSESMKHNLPVITSDLPDLKYLINKYKVGHTFKVGSIKDLTKVLKKTTDSKGDYSEYKRNTAKAAAFFDLNSTSAKLIDLISKNL